MGSRKLRLTDFLTTAQYTAHRRPLPPGMFLVLIFTRSWVDPQGHGLVGRKYVTEKSTDTTVNRSRDRPTSNTAPWPLRYPRPRIRKESFKNSARHCARNKLQMSRYFYSCYKCANRVTVLHLTLIVLVCPLVSAPYVGTQLVFRLFCSLLHTRFYIGAVNTAYEFGNHVVWINSCNLIIHHGGQSRCFLCLNPSFIYLFPDVKFEILTEIW